MIAKTIVSKSRRFDWKKLRRRAKKRMRQKHKKTIKLMDFDKIWKQYVEYAIIRPLLEYGVVWITDDLKMEITGTKITKSQSYNLLSNGIMYRNGRLTKDFKLNPTRRNYAYKIVFTCKKYKGQVVFDADKNLRKRLHDILCNTNRYYKIVA